MVNAPSIADYIFSQYFGIIRDISSKSKDLSMNTFDQALFDLYENGKITYEEALKNADSTNDVRMRIKLDSKRSEHNKVDQMMNSKVNLQIL